MANFSLSRLERLYAQVETTYGQIPNTAGAATVGNNNAVRFVKSSLDNQVAMIERPDKTGTRSKMVGILGRKAGGWSADMSIAPNGVAGTMPDMDPFMQMLMGQAGAAVAGSSAITAASNATPIVITQTAHGFSNYDIVFISGVTGNTAANGTFMITSVTTNNYTLVGSVGNGAYVSGGTGSRVSYRYQLSDSIVSGSVFSFRQPSTEQQRIAHGAVVSEATIQMGADVASISFTGDSQWILQSDQFGVADSIQLGGLTAFPTEPAAPTTNGGIIAGFTGLVAINNNLIATLRTATVRVRTANVVVRDTFGSYYPTMAEGDERTVSVQFSIYEDDSAAYQNLVAVSQSKLPVDIPLIIGTVNGSIMAVVLKSVQLAAHTKEEQRRFIANFPESRAHGTSLVNRDELTVVFI